VETMATDRNYDSDLALWAEDLARALRSAAHARINLPIDWENVAEEIECFGKSQGRELASRAEIEPAVMPAVVRPVAEIDFVGHCPLNLLTNYC